MPRSPSRDRSDRFTGFRGYVREPDRYARAKSAALVSAGVLVGLWLVVEAAHPRAGAYHTHGELANPHAAWDHDCAACHESQGVANFSLSEVLDAQKRWHKLTCTKCHAGPKHHELVKDTAFHDKCSNCHHDHAGRDASLTRLTDRHCTDCHKNLPAAHVASAGNYANVSAFAGDHPEFRVLEQSQDPQTKRQKDYAPRTLKFSHAVHMHPGLNQNVDVKWVADKSSSAAAERYREFVGANNQLALDCRACHQLDARVPTAADPNDAGRQGFERVSELLRGQARASILPPRAEGAYYLPVNFDAHCKACHPVAAPPGAAGGVELKNGFALPHRLQPAELEPLIRAGYAARLLEKNPAFAKTPVLPGGRLDPPDRPKGPTEFGAAVDALTATARGFVSATGATCAKCHVPAEDGKAVAALPPHTVWFAHATFNHVSHRGLDCQACHPGTGKPDGAPATRQEGWGKYRNEPVAILGADSCRACHAPAGTQVKQADGTTTTAAGVRHGCTDCHRYHNGDRPLHGLGSPKRDPETLLSLDQFLRGGKK
jgi:hypothetical protein